MKRQSVIVLAILFSTVLGAMSAFSQNMLVKVTDETGGVLVGTSTLIGFLNQTEIESFGQGSSACGFNAGPGVCRPTTENFTYNFLLDQTVTDYRKALYLGKIWKKVEISFLRFSGSGQPFTYQKILLEDVYVTGLSEGSSGDAVPTYQVSLDPSKITWTITPQLQNGNAGPSRSFGYNRVTNTSF